MLWRRRAALGVLALWGVVGLARLTRLTELSEAPPGQDAIRAIAFFKATIPQTAGYIFVEPGEFGSDTGTGQRLRYELYPRSYDKVRASVDESNVRQLMHAEGLSFVVVPDAGRYDSTSWLRQPRGWLRRIEFDALSYVLEVVS
jgi:hypothetical protein